MPSKKKPGSKHQRWLFKPGNRKTPGLAKQTLAEGQEKIKIFCIQSKPGFTHSGTKSGIKSAKIPKIGIVTIYAYFYKIKNKKTFY